ncbi:MAG: DJ-1/PfpI family protein [Endomicrobium sp.]|jgi:protease I|nr:DJ-1/PfpI family protein [Endomicrobium sp.]
MKRVVFIVAPEMFRDEEYCKPKQILEDAGINVITASVKTGELIGRFGFKAISSTLIGTINPDNFNAIAYIGGSGCEIFFNNPYALKLANIFFEQRKPVASICIAGVILANSGILKNKKATVYIDGKDSLLKGGAIYMGNSLEVDGGIITANGPQVAEEFGKAILKILESKFTRVFCN